VKQKSTRCEHWALTNNETSHIDKKFKTTNIL